MILRVITKATVVIAAVAFVLACVVPIVYDWHEVRPRLPEIRATLETFTSEDRIVPANVADFVWKLDQKREIDINTQVVRTLVGQALPMKAAAWHAHNLMWSLLLPFHFDKQERTALYCHNILYENGKGLSNAAEYYFHKLPRELSSEEVAGIIAIDRSPNGNSPTRHPDRYARTTKRLLDAYVTP